MLFSRPGKELLGGCDVTPFAQEKVDGAALLIDGAIEVDPLAFDLDVSLIHTPRIAHRPRVRLPAFSIPARSAAPTEDGRMGR